MNTNIFGRYTNYQTPIHKIDPRMKLFLLILLISTIFFQFSIWSTNLIFSFLILLLFVCLMFLSKSSFKSLLKSILSMWFLILFLLVVYCLIPNAKYTHPAFKINSLTIYYDSFYQCGYIILRLILMISITMILTGTTKPMDLTYAFEWYMTPLKVLKAPTHAWAMTISLSLRLIPTLLDEANRILKAQASRGIDFETGGVFKKIKSIISLIIPLFISSFQRSDELSLAMEARGYDPLKERTRYRTFSLHLIDFVSFLLVGAFFALVLTLFIFDKTGNKIDIVKMLFKVDVGF